jgi:AhpD family alkylhydroperoxidase
VAHYHELLDDLRPPYETLAAAVPDLTAAYADLRRAATKDGALSSKVKELIALAVAITRECDGCVASHARSAHRRGATEAEVAEMVGVTVLMNGGPATVWGARALQAFAEFAADRPTDPAGTRE